MEIPGFKITRTIGQGGMATAYLAVQESLGREVVLKILNSARVESPESVERFLNEGRIVAKLNHPYIITIYDIGIAEDLIYISMEYVEGGDLKDRMADFSNPARALDLIVKVGGALGAVHKHGIIHRDVKPGNILFRNLDTPLLTDFGIAKEVELDHDLTSTGIFLGSPNYMAPEQADGGGIDGRADIYSLGIILFEMLTGEKPYKSRSIVDLIVQHKQAPIPRLPDALQAYQPLLDLMLAKRRSDRFRDVDSMLHFIQKLQVSGEVVTIEKAVSNPDFDISGVHQRPEPVAPAPVVGGPESTVERRPRNTLLAALLLVAVGIYGGLEFAERSLNAPSEASLPALPAALPGPAALPAPPPAGSLAGTEPIPDTAEVMQALRWLARSCLQDYKLISPPKDNAYYYYTRMLEIDPTSREAREGLLKVAERFARLAERELADNHVQRAREYIALGLRIDPANQALLALKELAVEKPPGLWRRLTQMLGRH